MIPNFECGKICLVDGLFVKAVFLKKRWPGWKTNGQVGSKTSVVGLHIILFEGQNGLFWVALNCPSYHKLEAQ